MPRGDAPDVGLPGPQRVSGARAALRSPAAAQDQVRKEEMLGGDARGKPP